MSIDPEKFEPQGKPTRQQARAVWDAHPSPSTRKCAVLMRNRGFDISDRTYARWHANEWREEAAKGLAPMAERQHTPRGVNKEIRSELAKLPKATTKEAKELAMAGGLDAAMAGGALKDEDYARIERRGNELKLMSQAELDVAEAKARKVMNIILMEEATRRAHVMVLIPKDTASLVDAFTDASRVTISGGDGQPPKDGDLRTIDGESHRVEPEPENATARAISQFLVRESA